MIVAFTNTWRKVVEVVRWYCCFWTIQHPSPAVIRRHFCTEIDEEGFSSTAPPLSEAGVHWEALGTVRESTTEATLNRSLDSHPQRSSTRTLNPH